MRYLKFLVIALIAAFGFVYASCSSDPPPNKNKDAGAEASVDAAQPDAPAQDTSWPDLPQDQWPDQADSYAGSKFGCFADSDCFGQKCCPTPWGIRLCAASCL